MKGRREEGFEAVLEGQSTKHAALVENRCQLCPPVSPQIDEVEPGFARQKSIDDHLVLFGLARTGRVDQPSAWPYHGSRALKQGELTFGKRREIVCVPDAT